MRSSNDLLFASYDLRGVLEAQEQKMLQEIDSIPQGEVLEIEVEQLCDYMEENYRVDVPKIDYSAVTVDQKEAQIDVSQDRMRAIMDRSQPFYIIGTSITYYLPFEGDAELFSCTPSTRNYNPPTGRTEGNELVLTYTAPEQDAERVRAAFDHDAGNIRNYLSWIANDVRGFNAALRDKARGRIESRRGKALKDKGVVADLGYPIRRREDAAPTYAVPTVRKKPSFPKPKPGKKPAAPEPVLAEAQYEDILSIIENMVTVIERSPHAFVGMGEEHLRQHFLVQLNGQYEGQATGETFNFEGKTDILVRVEGKNVFIAECKFWQGPAGLTKTIDQLLGYTSWRDTKTAIILFNRKKNFSSVLAKIPEVVSAHPNCLRELAVAGETKCRFVLRHRDDPERELLLTIVAFDIPIADT
jgi:hypothetical protein